ncbi:hypothetical protein M9Y10_010439 [Tritrichomonas musculus]|uniref:DUF3447 domain-containing protein n=1 Tax=Tritrichomonas musculus TaxID=1915356 RepID=A0ABR2IKW5_9EUKA
METQEYIDEMIEFQEKVLEFIDGEEDGLSFDELSNYMDTFEIQEILKGFIEFLHFLVKLTNNHHRTPEFFPRIQQIIAHFKDPIKENLTNSEIFNIFQSNKPILLFLIKEGILIPDQNIADQISNEFFRAAKYLHYFYPEFKDFINDKKVKEEVENIINNENLEKFETSRQKGENDDILSTIIQNDSIDDFITYINSSSIPFSTTIEPTIYESNSFLFNKSPCLIEYASFYGSIQIFKYLYINKAEMTPSIWLYAIHGRNPELIHLLEEKKIYTSCFKITKDLTISDYYIEAIKCHHNELADYIQNNLIQYEQINEDDVRFNSLKHYNYSFFPEDLNNDTSFFYLCQFGYPQLVRIILKTGNININARIILIFKIFNTISINFLNTVSFNFFVNFVSKSIFFSIAFQLLKLFYQVQNQIF